MGTQTLSISSLSAPEHRPAVQPFGAAFDDVGHVVERIQQELQVLRAEQAAIAKRIGLIKGTIAGLKEVFGQNAVGDELHSGLTPRPLKRRCSRGLTDACRELLAEASEPQTLKQISGRILERHPALLAHHKYPMTIIQMMLRRLVMYGEAEELHETAGLRCWKSASVQPW